MLLVQLHRVMKINVPILVRIVQVYVLLEWMQIPSYRDVVCVSPDQKIIDVKHIYEKRDFHHHIPVTEAGKLVGIVSLVDFMYRIRGAGLDDNNPVYKSHTLTVVSLDPVAINLESDEKATE